MLVHGWKWFFLTNTENFILLNVGHTMSPVRVVKRTEAARGFGCVYRDQHTDISQINGRLSNFFISLSKMHTSPLKKTHQIYSNLKNCKELCRKNWNQSKYWKLSPMHVHHTCIYTWIWGHMYRIEEFSWVIFTSFMIPSVCILLFFFIIISEFLFNNITVQTMSTGSPSQDQ